MAATFGIETESAHSAKKSAPFAAKNGGRLRAGGMRRRTRVLPKTMKMERIDEIMTIDGSTVGSKWLRKNPSRIARLATS